MHITKVIDYTKYKKLNSISIYYKLGLIMNNPKETYADVYKKPVTFVTDPSKLLEGKVKTQYLLKIIFSKSNIMVNVTDVKGLTVMKETIGNLKQFQGSQKTKKIALNVLLRKLKFRFRELKTTAMALQLQGSNRNKIKWSKNVINYFNIPKIFSENVHPFNGCKYKKIKRKKFKSKLLLK